MKFIELTTWDSTPIYININTIMLIAPAPTVLNKSVENCTRLIFTNPSANPVLIKGHYNEVKKHLTEG